MSIEHFKPAPPIEKQDKQEQNGPPKPEENRDASREKNEDTEKKSKMIIERCAEHPDFSPDARKVFLAAMERMSDAEKVQLTNATITWGNFIDPKRREFQAELEQKNNMKPGESGMPEWVGMDEIEGAAYSLRVTVEKHVCDAAGTEYSDYASDKIWEQKQKEHGAEYFKKNPESIAVFSKFHTSLDMGVMEHVAQGGTLNGFREYTDPTNRKDVPIRSDSPEMLNWLDGVTAISLSISKLKGRNVDFRITDGKDKDLKTPKEILAAAEANDIRLTATGKKDTNALESLHTELSSRNMEFPGSAIKNDTLAFDEPLKLHQIVRVLQLSKRLPPKEKGVEAK